MKKDKLEMLSEFVDMELSDLEVDVIIEDESLHSKWNSYNIIGETIRNKTPSYTNHSIADKVKLALADEPTVFSPNNLSTKNSKPKYIWAAAASVMLIVGSLAIQAINVSKPLDNVALPKVDSNFKTRTVVKNGHEIERLSGEEVTEYLNRQEEAARTKVTKKSVRAVNYLK